MTTFVLCKLTLTPQGARPRHSSYLRVRKIAIFPQEVEEAECGEGPSQIATGGLCLSQCPASSASAAKPNRNRVDSFLSQEAGTGLSCHPFLIPFRLSTHSYPNSFTYTKDKWFLY